MFLMAVACLSGCSRKSDKPAASALSQAVPVRTTRVTTAQLDRIISVPGSIVSRDVSTVSVKVAGRIQSIQVELGAEVAEGGVIAKLDPRDAELQLREAMAALAQARARLSLPLDGNDDTVVIDETSTVKQAKAVLIEAQKKRDRIQLLSKQRILSESELEVASSEYEVAVSRHEDARSEVRLRQAILMQRRVEVDAARQQLADTIVRAPFPGRVQERKANLGEYLVAGAPVATLVRSDALRLRAEVPERDAARVRIGQDVRIVVEGTPKPTPAQVSRISPALSQDNRMLFVEADLHPGSGFRPGTFARAEFIVARESSAMAAPTNALSTFAGIEKLFVVENGVVSERNRSEEHTLNSSHT